MVAEVTLVIEEAADLEVGQGREGNLAERIRDTWMAYWRLVRRLGGLWRVLRRVYSVWMNRLV